MTTSTALLFAYGQAKALPLTAAATFVFMLRVVSLRRRWSAPVATLRPSPTGTRGPGAEPRPRRRPWRLLATVRGARPGNWQPGAPDVTSVASGGERCRRWLC